MGRREGEGWQAPLGDGGVRWGVSTGAKGRVGRGAMGCERGGWGAGECGDAMSVRTSIRRNHSRSGNADGKGLRASEKRRRRVFSFHHTGEGEGGLVFFIFIFFSFFYDGSTRLPLQQATHHRKRPMQGDSFRMVGGGKDRWDAARRRVGWGGAEEAGVYEGLRSF